MSLHSSCNFNVLFQNYKGILKIYLLRNIFDLLNVATFISVRNTLNLIFSVLSEFTDKLNIYSSFNIWFFIDNSNCSCRIHLYVAFYHQVFFFEAMFKAQYSNVMLLSFNFSCWKVNMQTKNPWLVDMIT